MTFPVNEAEFIGKWLSILNNPDEGDKEQAKATFRQSTEPIMLVWKMAGKGAHHAESDYDSGRTI